MDRGEDGRARRGAAAQMVHKAGVRAIGVFEIGVFGFFRERIGVEPLEQLEIHAESAERELWRVDVQVGHARNNELAGIVQQRQRGILRRKRGEYARDAAVFTDKIAVVHGLHGVCVGAEAETALQYKIFQDEPCSFAR